MYHDHDECLVELRGPGSSCTCSPFAIAAPPADQPLMGGEILLAALVPEFLPWVFSAVIGNLKLDIAINQSSGFLRLRAIAALVDVDLMNALKRHEILVFLQVPNTGEAFPLPWVLDDETSAQIIHGLTGFSVAEGQQISDPELLNF